MMSYYYDYTHTYTGECVASLPERAVMVTGGEVGVGVWWAEDEQGRLMCPPGLPSADDNTTPNPRNLMDLKKWAGT